jgi:hypothetical protein
MPSHPSSSEKAFLMEKPASGDEAGKFWIASFLTALGLMALFGVAVFAIAWWHN